VRAAINNPGSIGTNYYGARKCYVVRDLPL